LKKRLVVIVGAGASKDLGLPLGRELQTQVNDLLVKNRGLERESFFHASSVLFGNKQSHAIEVMKRAVHFAPRMLSAPSIDNFLDQHHEDTDLVLLMKMAISFSIARAEQRSLIGSDAGIPEQFIPKTADFFLYDLMNIVMRGHQLDNLKESLANLCIVTFNYDRCIERYLASWLNFRFGTRAASIARIPKIIHVYGSIGRYFDNENVSNFSHDGPLPYLNTHLELPYLAPRIKIFTEQEDSETRDQIAEEFTAADVVCSIGFGFEEQNMRFFRFDQLRKSVFATLLGMSRDNAEHLTEILSGGSSKLKPRAMVVDGAAKKLFSDLYFPFTKAVGSI
jgi:NAD-dependent SIR2 family protein deacetylase